MAYTGGMRIRFLAVVLALAAVPAVAGEYFIPAVAQLKGVDGAYWNTELWVVNSGENQGSYALTFLPSRRNNARRLLEEGEVHTLGPHQSVHLRDVVPVGRVGALRVVTSPDVLVQCRLFNASRSGSVGQMVPALTVGEMIQPGERALLFPLVRSPRFRTNVGFFNPNPNAIEVVATVLDGEGRRISRVTYHLEPGEQAQVNDVLLAFKVERSEGHQMMVEAEGAFAAYASLVDNRSGAPTLVQPIPLR